ncbi:hypothetical protein LCGC14_0717010 [marine sediment metagenome]|uniref:Uncharacterized protein n=1 Tax=marine sediment metagenome TaxID=412755 RepID=A0A0F9TKX3_9ZZZZ|nr:hypothetical protein [bacterium]
MATLDTLCNCNIAAEFPILRGLGIISANLRTNTDVTLTAANVPLYGATTGDISITAYAPLSGEDLKCPGRAGVSYNWDRRIECESGSLTTHFIPRGGIKAYVEGPITRNISITTVRGYTSFSASASSGPTTPYIYNLHQDGYNFSYSGDPIAVSSADSKNPKTLSIFTGTGVDILAGATYYLQSFSWEYTPPNVPTVSYSFLLSYDG